MVFLHGLMGSLSNWRRIIKELESEFEILAYDQRGHGKSFRPPTGYAPMDYAKDLIELLDDLKWKEVFLVGHSMGGRNAIQAAALVPHRIKKLVIEDISPRGDEKGLQKIQFLLSQVPVPFPSREAARTYLFGPFEKEVLKGDSHAHVLAQFFYSNIITDETGRADWRFYKEGILESARMGREVDLWPTYEALSMPILIIRGEHSKDLTREEAQKMLQKQPRAQLVEVKGAGHWVHFDRPKEFIQAIADFFKSS
ncbi:MAG: alpha/beta hydrolase [Bdellovibrio sp.]|nr:MAG: alpha/beta hydrolase [Bdellovibrio sp.]